MSVVKVTRGEPVKPPFVIELDEETALKLAGLLVYAVYFEEEEWARELHNAIDDATDQIFPAYTYDSESGFFKRGK